MKPKLNQLTETEYPSLLKRVQATFVDQIIAFLLLVLFIVIANNINEDLIALKVAAFVLGFSYEPLMIFKSRTIVQRMTGTKVEWANPNYSLKLLALYKRHVLKILLGWVSLLTVSFNKRKRAIHDIAAGTVVVYA